jgi:hypothetical protein
MKETCPIFQILENHNNGVLSLQQCKYNIITELENNIGVDIETDARNISHIKLTQIDLNSQYSVYPKGETYLNYIIYWKLDCSLIELFLHP